MRLLLGFIIGLLLGGLLAVVLASRAASRLPNDAAIFVDDSEPSPRPAVATS